MKRPVVVWHNPRCSKSRAALSLLEAAGVAVEVREYLAAPPTEEEIRAVLGQLGMRARELVRRGEAAFKDLGLANADDDALVAAMGKNPILIERPIAIAGERAVIGRPPERVKELVSG